MSVDGFGPAAWIAAVLALIGAVAGSFLPGRRQETDLIVAPAPELALEAEG